MKTRTGKIARLPKPIREQLNQRLENGETGTSLVAWLNQLPEVQKIITDQFSGRPIRAQNLSEWRKGGYLDWLRHQLLREQTRWTAEQAAELGLDTTGKSISIAEDIATVMSAELTLHVHALGEIKNPKQRFHQFCRLSGELSRLRRDDQRTLRNQLLHGYPHLHTPPHPVERNSVEPKLPPPVGDDVRSLKHPSPAEAPCRQEPKDAPNAPTSSFCILPSFLPQEAPAPRASVPDSGSPLPPCDSEPKRENPIPQPQPINNPTPAENPPYNPPLPVIAFPQPSAPIRVNPHRNYYDPRPPIRGRRFVRIEG